MKCYPENQQSGSRVIELLALYFDIQEELCCIAVSNFSVSLILVFILFIYLFFLIVNQVYEKLCSYLTIPDVALLIYTLECVYALSSLGQTTCNAFLHCPGTLDILISLLTIEVTHINFNYCRHRLMHD